jgi:hypothetical protein
LTGKPPARDELVRQEAVGRDRRFDGVDRHRCGAAEPRSVLSFCNSPQNAPEAYISFEPGLIEDDGTVTVESAKAFLRSFMEEFDGFIERVYTVLPRTS